MIEKRCDGMPAALGCANVLATQDVPRPGEAPDGWVVVESELYPGETFTYCPRCRKLPSNDAQAEA